LAIRRDLNLKMELEASLVGGANGFNCIGDKLDPLELPDAIHPNSPDRR
jgi:hypothetical protein